MKAVPLATKESIARLASKPVCAPKSNNPANIKNMIALYHGFYTVYEYFSKNNLGDTDKVNRYSDLILFFKSLIMERSTALSSAPKTWSISSCRKQFAAKKTHGMFKGTQRYLDAMEYLSKASELTAEKKNQFYTWANEFIASEKSNKPAGHFSHKFNLKTSESSQATSESSEANPVNHDSDDPNSVQLTTFSS